MATASLNKKHRRHFSDEGWTPEEIALAIEYGVRSVTQSEATKLLGYTPPSGGIWFAFSKSWGQLRPDSRQYPDGRESPKYCSPKGNIGPQALWLPPGSSIKDLVAITEGWKDAFLATVRGGRPVGAIAGVSHVIKALPPGCGRTLAFDSDGLKNANVMQALIGGGLHLNGRIVLIPEEYGDHAGVTEFFKNGGIASSFGTLLDNAQTPRDLFINWLDYLLAASLPKHCNTAVALYRRLFRLAYHIGRDCPELIARVEQFCKQHAREHGTTLGIPAIRKIRDMALAPFRRQEHRGRQQAAKQRIRAQVRQSSWNTSGCFDSAVEFTDCGIRIAKAGKLASLLESSWGDRLQFRSDVSGFYAYGFTTPGLWERVRPYAVGELVQRELDASGADGEYSQGTVEGAIALFSQRVAMRNWPQSRGFIPFRNGVLRLSDLKLLPHDPDYHLTWQLPYKYLPGAKCEPVVEWLRWVTDEDNSVVQLLRAVLRCLLLGRSAAFQRYIELIGPGGTGKGVFTRITQALVGRQNTVSTSFSRIANSRFETSRFVDKRVLLIPDADYNPTAVDTLKQLTGGDYIPWERKGENPDAGDGFVFDGLVMIATNTEVAASDRTNALFRRRVPIYVTRTVPDSERRQLLDFDSDGKPVGDFAQYLPGVINWLLSMPDELMEAYIRTPSDYVRSISTFQAESLLNSDNLALWANEWLVAEEGAMTKVGNKHNSATDCLYPNYWAYCEAANLRPLSMNKFSGALENLLQKQLGLEVSKTRDRSLGAVFKNIRLLKTDTQYESSIDPNSPSQQVPTEEIPLLVERSLRGESNFPLANSDLTRFLNLYHDDHNTYDAELRRLSSAQIAYLLEKLPELREGNKHALH